MILHRQTASLCSTCYKEVPAVVDVQDGKPVLITKRCSEHGEQVGVLERDPTFYTYISSLANPSIYDGYFVDVTQRCNLRCAFCYYALKKEDPAGLYSVDRILNDCLAHAHHAPFIFTGGEPTLHPELPTILREARQYGPVELLTNGVKLAEDQGLYDAVIPLLAGSSPYISLNLSIHKETDGWSKLIKKLKSDTTKIESALIVVDSKQSFIEALKIASSLNPVVQGFRIKAASRIWNEQKPARKIFVSDMLRWLDEENVRYQFITVGRQNKSVFVNIMCAGMYIMLVSWHDVTNVDLLDISCPPYYRAANGEVQNMVTAMLINEGMSKGYAKGSKWAKP